MCCWLCVVWLLSLIVSVAVCALCVVGDLLCVVCCVWLLLVVYYLLCVVCGMLFNVIVV